ncbi:MAG: hypothetical protein IAE85_06015 [Anaerolinea sp.]|nr:hypothetical protein [Anaerolinea sp.]
MWPQALTLRTTLPGLRLRVADSGGDRLVVELHKGHWPTSIQVMTQVVHHGDSISHARSAALPGGYWFASTLIVLHSPAELEKLEHWLDSMPPEVAAHFHMPGRATHQEAAA